MSDINKKPEPKNYPFLDIYNTGGVFMGIARGVVFNAEQAREAFQYVNAPIILCVDGPVCKWVECFQHAIDFFEPPIRFICDECHHVMTGKDEIEYCLMCGDGDITRIGVEEINKAKLELAKIVAGDL